MKKKKKTPAHLKKLSEMLLNMAMSVLKEAEFYDEDAMSVALLFSMIAWNAEVEQLKKHDLSPYMMALIEIEAHQPEFWSNFKILDYDKIINNLRLYKKLNHPFDKRLLLNAGINAQEKVEVTWKRN